MPREGHSPEQVLNKLRQVEIAVAGGKSVGQAVHGIGVTDHTYYRWRPVSEIISGNAIGGRSIPPGQKMPCPVRVPTYNDYTVIGNLVMMCEGDDGKPLEPSTNCKELEKWLTK